MPIHYSSPARSAAPSLGGFLATAAVAIVLCSVFATTLAVLDAQAVSRTDKVIQLAGILAAAMFLGAGVLRISRWRVANDRSSLLMGTALVVLGGLGLPLTSLAGALTGYDPDSFLRAVTAITTTLATILLVRRALHPSTGSPSAVRLTASVCAVVLLSFACLVVLHFQAPEVIRSEVVEPGAVRGAVLGCAWLAIGLHAARRGREMPWAARVSPLLVCMGVGELMRVFQAYQEGSWGLAGAGLVAVIALTAANRALNDLDEAAMAGQTALQATTEELAQTRSHVDAQHAWREELTHDARNALAGLRAALHVLERYAGELDPAALERLRAAAIDEVGHLEDMILRGQGEPVNFDIADAIRATVETRRAAGLQVEMHDFSCAVHGHPSDLARVVQNILVNSQTHAPGAKVRICVVPAGQKVHLYIADDGPGLSHEQAVHVFERGSRDPTHGGSGLGLFVARSLMRQQGGDVDLRGHFEGAVFVVTLPAARMGTSIADVKLPQQRVPPVAKSKPLGATT